MGKKAAKAASQLPNEVIRLCEEGENSFQFSYEDDMSIKDKINAIATKIYGADGVDYTPEADAEIAKLTKLGFDKVPVCMAKTQYFNR